jgi:putative ABC transport system ATP-binding protein
MVRSTAFTLAASTLIDNYHRWEPVYHGRRLLRHDLCRLRLTKISFIFQTHNLLPFLNGTDNVAEAMGISPRAAHTRSDALLDCLDIGPRRRAMPSELTGGEAQRVAIARGLAGGTHGDS